MPTSSDSDDSALLVSFERKLQLIRDRVRGVAEGYYTATYLVGPPGTSKTLTVKAELERLAVPHVIHYGPISPRGLFNLLADNPRQIIVLDDIVTLFRHKQALQVLLAALEGDPKQPRLITFKTGNEDHKIEFLGGVVMISNVPLQSDPLAQAVASRVVLLKHEPTDEEIAAFTRRLAQDRTS